MAGPSSANLGASTSGSEPFHAREVAVDSSMPSARCMKPSRLLANADSEPLLCETCDLDTRKPFECVRRRVALEVSFCRTSLKRGIMVGRQAQTMAMFSSISVQRMAVTGLSTTRVYKRMPLDIVTLLGRIT